MAQGYAVLKRDFKNYESLLRKLVGLLKQQKLDFSYVEGETETVIVWQSKWITVKRSDGVEVMSRVRGPERKKKNGKAVV